MSKICVNKLTHESMNYSQGNAVNKVCRLKGTWEKKIVDQLLEKRLTLST